MLTVLLIALPLIGALCVLPTKGNTSRNLALGFALLEFAFSMYTFFVFRADHGAAGLTCIKPWVQSFGINFSVSIDSLSILLVLLTTFLVPLIILSSYGHQFRTPNSFYALVLTMQMALVGVFTATDGFLFYVFWELALIPIYFICLLWGGENRGAITFKFFVYTLFGSLFMLIGFIYLYNHTGSYGEKSWALQDLYNAGRSLDLTQQSAIFWLIFIAFAIKMPIFPFHTWQPDTYVNAPTPGTMLLSGIMLKMGTFGAIRWLLPVVPLGVEKWGGTVMVLAVIGIVYASCIAITQKDYKRLIAYSSIAHVGLIAAGIFSQTQQGIQGAIMQMLAHGVNVVGLFFVADILVRHTGTRDTDKLGGIRNMNGNFAVYFLIIVLGAVALPLTNGFVGEFLLISGVFQYSGVMAAFAGLTVILGAVYMLRSYQNIMLGERRDTQAAFGALSPADKTVLVVICASILFFGVYPKPLNDIAQEGARSVLELLR
jgi:NADH-quinone oxidoreductase subunit M